MCWHFQSLYNIVLHLLSIRRHPDKSLSVRKGPLHEDHDGDPADVDDVEGGVWSPHDHTGTKRQPLVVTDYLVRSPFHLRPSQLDTFLSMGTFTHSTGDVDVEAGGDEDGGGEGEKEEQGEVVHDEAEVGKDFQRKTH